MDLEMTGLDHTRDLIVEIATIVTAALASLDAMPFAEPTPWLVRMRAALSELSR